NWTAALKQRVRKDRDVLGRRKQTGVSGNSSHHAAILVLDFSLDDPVAERLIIRRPRNSPAQSRRGVGGRVRHADRAKNFALAKDVQWLVGDSVKSHPQNNESDVAVLRMRTGVVGERSCKSCLQQLLATMSV